MILGDGHQVGHVTRGVGGGGSTGGGQAVIASSARVVFAGAGLVAFGDPSGGLHALDSAVEGAWADADAVAGLAGDFLHDGVAVAFLGGEGEEDLEFGLVGGGTCHERRIYRMTIYRVKN